MDAIALLKADHKTVEKLFKEFEKLVKKDGSPAEKKKVVDQISKELVTHAWIEEQLFYPDIREQNDEIEDDVLEALEEHHIVKWTLSELANMDPSAERYDAKVTVLMESVRHHVEEEESEMFPEVRKSLGRKGLQEMGVQLQKLKKTAPNKPMPQLPDEPPSSTPAKRAAKAVAAKDAAKPRTTPARKSAATKAPATKAPSKAPTRGRAKV